MTNSLLKNEVLLNIVPVMVSLIKCNVDVYFKRVYAICLSVVLHKAITFVKKNIASNHLNQLLAF